MIVPMKNIFSDIPAIFLYTILISNSDISGFLIFWISNAATSITILVIGSNLFMLSINLIWLSSLCWIEGASHPSGFFRLRNLGGLYHVFLLRLALRYCFLSELSFTISERSFISAEYTSFLSVVADNPTFKNPLSTPRIIGCFVSPVAYFS